MSKVVHYMRTFIFIIYSVNIYKLQFELWTTEYELFSQQVSAKSLELNKVLRLLEDPLTVS